MIQYLLSNNLDHLERTLRRDAKHEHVAMDSDAVLALQNTVLVLSSCINNLGREILAFVFDHCAKGVLDGRVVGFDKVVLDVLDSQRGFAC